MRKVSLAGVTLSLLILMLVAALSCTIARTEPVDKTIVQVWEPSNASGESDELEAFGVVVGDGSQVLTVVNYEEYNPGELEVVLPVRGKYSASIQAIDSRSGATLLKLKDARLPAATLGNSTTINTGQQVIIRGWTGPELVYKKTPALISSFQYTLPLAFNVDLTDEARQEGGWVSAQGAVVTDEKGNVLGLESIDYYRLAPRLGYMGYIPPIISINSALELLAPDASQQPWANGPLLFNVNAKNGRSGVYDGFVNDYATVANAIQNVLTELGKPLSASDLPPQGYFWYAWPNESSDGTLLTTVYPRPVELRDSEGKVLVQAKWVGIQWGRSEGKPNRLFYGTVAYTVAGSFEIVGDVTNLASAVRTMINNPYIRTAP